jgi:hypothetical protein
VKGAISRRVPNMMSYANISTVFLQQDDFWGGPAKKKRKFLTLKTYYKGNVKLSSFLDPLLYFYLKQLFHNISFIKNTNVYYQGNEEIQWQHQHSLLL